MQTNEVAVTVVSEYPAPRRHIIIADLSTRRINGTAPTSLLLTVRGDASPRAMRATVHLLASMLEASLDVDSSKPDWDVSVSTLSNTVRLDAIAAEDEAHAKTLVEEVARQTPLVDDVQFAMSWKV